MFLPALFLAVTACDDGLTPGGKEPVPSTVVLRGEGIEADGAVLPFSADRTQVEEAVNAVLGEPEARTSFDECGAGPMQFTRYANGFTVNFQKEALVGWFYDKANPKVALANGITVGTPRERVGASPQFLPIEGSTLGEEFSLGEAVGGFLEAGKVASLYGGVNCFFR